MTDGALPGTADVLDEVELTGLVNRLERRDYGLRIVRALTADDLYLLEGKPPVAGAYQKRRKAERVRIRHTHHRLAEMIVQGGVTLPEMSVVSGLTPRRIMQLKNEPEFRELVNSYEKKKEKIFVDVMERCKILGMSMIEEVQQRLEEDPGSFSNRELLEGIDQIMCKLPASLKAPVNGNGGGNSVEVNVKFVTAEPKVPMIEAPVDVPFVDLEAAE